jgi:hypothetical protein
VTLDVNRHRLPAAGEHHVGGVGRCLQAGGDQLAGDVDARHVGGEPVVGHDEDVGRRCQPALVEGRQHASDLAIVVRERFTRGRRAHAEVVLAVIRLGEPVDDDVGRELRQHVLAEDALCPRDHLVVAVECAPRGRRSELGEDRRAHLGRPRHQLAGLEGAVDDHADSVAGSRIGQERAARRARADGGEAKPARVEALSERPGQHESSVRRVVEGEQSPMVAGVQRAARIHRRHVHLVPQDSVRARVHPGAERGGVDPRHRREYRVAVREVDALGPQAVQGGRAIGGDGVGSEPVDDEHDDETGAGRHEPLC